MLGEKKVGKITSVERVEEIPEGVEVQQFSFKAEVVDEETLNDIKYGKHRHISIGSNLEQSDGVGDGDIS